MLRKIKKGMLQSPIVLAAPLETRLEKRPFTKTILAPLAAPMNKTQKIALGLLLVPTSLAFISSLFSAQWPLFFITGFLLLLFGLMVWIIKLRSKMVWKVTWHQDSVEVVDGRYGKAQQWTEPIATFNGLMRDSGRIAQGVIHHTINRKVHGLLLAHPDPTKSILLHASRQAIGDDIVAYYGEQLGKTLLK